MLKVFHLNYGSIYFSKILAKSLLYRALSKILSRNLYLYKNIIAINLHLVTQPMLVGSLRLATNITTHQLQSFTTLIY